MNLFIFQVSLFILRVKLWRMVITVWHEQAVTHWGVLCVAAVAVKEPSMEPTANGVVPELYIHANEVEAGVSERLKVQQASRSNRKFGGKLVQTWLTVTFASESRQTAMIVA